MDLEICIAPWFVQVNGSELQSDLLQGRDSERVFGSESTLRRLLFRPIETRDGTAASGQSKAQTATGVSSTQEGCPESNAERTFQTEDEKAPVGGGISRRFRGREIEFGDSARNNAAAQTLLGCRWAQHRFCLAGAA
jgi:hypothetical protein